MVSVLCSLWNAFYCCSGLGALSFVVFKTLNLGATLGSCILHLQKFSVHPLVHYFFLFDIMLTRKFLNSHIILMSL